MRPNRIACLLITSFTLCSTGTDATHSTNERGFPIETWEEVKKLLASDATAKDFFGNSVSISGNTAVIGAWGNDDTGIRPGSAYIYYRNQDGTDNWGEVTELTASDAEDDDLFGWSVSIDGDTVVIGAWGNDDAGISSGSAYIFRRDHGGTDNWGEVTKLTASDIAAGDFFGRAVSISGDTVVIGARGNDDDGENSGSAYIFQRDHDGTDNWGEVTKLTASGAATGDSFGRSVSISGDTAVVGATLSDDNGTDSGSAYIFYRNHDGADNWGEVTKLTASDAAPGNHFSSSSSISGDTVVVGANRSNDAGDNSGSAYVFHRDHGGTDNWGEVSKLIASDGAASDFFGWSVSISGNTAAIGAHLNDDSGDDSGSVYIFHRDQGGPDNWGETTKLIASDIAAGDLFGASVSISGNTAAIGAHLNDDAGSVSGSAYIFAPVQRVASQCDGGITHDDGFSEGGNGQSGPGGFVQEFTVSGLGAALTDVCIAWSRAGPDTDISYDIVVYDDDGPGGGPGTELLSFPTGASGVPETFDPVMFFSTEINGELPVLPEGTYFIGALWDGVADEMFFINHDSSETTPYVPSYSTADNGSTWTEVGAGALRALFIRADFADVAGTVEPPEEGVLIGGFLNPNFSTIVLTHGLQGVDTPISEIWTGFEDNQAGALIREALGGAGAPFNVVQWVWHGAFQGTFTGESYQAAQENVAQSALILANQLKEELDASYDKPIHFIAHSLGTAVNAYAAALFLNDRPLVTQAQVTVLDRPDNIRELIIDGNDREFELRYGYLEGFLHQTLFNFTRPVDQLRVENYYSTTGFGVGDIAQGDIYNHRNFINPGVLNTLIFREGIGNDHSGVHQWYRWSIDPVGILSNPDPPDTLPCIGGKPNPEFFDEKFLNTSLSPCNRGWFWSVVLNEGVDMVPENNGPPLSGTRFNLVDTANFMELGCTVSSSGISCSESTSRSRVIQGVDPLAAALQLDVPERTQFVSFEYRFSAAGEGDYAAVFLDGVMLWEVSAMVAGANPDFVSVIPIPVGDVEGNHLMSIALYGTGSPDTVFEVRNIEFLTELPFFADGFESGDTSAWSFQTP